METGHPDTQGVALGSNVAAFQAEKISLHHFRLPRRKRGDNISTCYVPSVSAAEINREERLSGIRNHVAGSRGRGRGVFERP
jgi:hypothetical protein